LKRWGEFGHSLNKPEIFRNLLIGEEEKGFLRGRKTGFGRELLETQRLLHFIVTADQFTDQSGDEVKA